MRTCAVRAAWQSSPRRPKGTSRKALDKVLLRIGEKANQVNAVFRVGWEIALGKLARAYSQLPEPDWRPLRIKTHKPILQKARGNAKGTSIYKNQEPRLAREGGTWVLFDTYEIESMTWNTKPVRGFG